VTVISPPPKRAGTTRNHSLFAPVGELGELFFSIQSHCVSMVIVSEGLKNT